MIVFFKIVIWIAIGMATAYAARERGRDPRVWLIIGMLFGVFGLLLVFLLPKENSANASPNTDMEEIEIFPVSQSVEGEAVSEHLPRDYKAKYWFYLDQDRKEVGPLTFQQLFENWTLNLLREDSFVWCEEMKEWRQIRELNLFSIH